MCFFNLKFIRWVALGTEALKLFKSIFYANTDLVYLLRLYKCLNQLIFPASLRLVKTRLTDRKFNCMLVLVKALSSTFKINLTKRNIHKTVVVVFCCCWGGGGGGLSSASSTQTEHS